ncbi:MAG: RNA 2',3'-cyclic phosphodiesterase [Planctomycetota bacterium]|jgi:2'-5' RNA ligase
MRAFLAIPLPQELREAIVKAREGFSGLRPVPTDQLHLTIRFLGEISKPVKVAEAVEAVADVHAPFDVTLERLGCFPNRKAARVVWVGLGKGDLRAGSLAAGIELALLPLGFEHERRTWHGHVTLGRFPDPKRLRKNLLDPTASFGGFRAEEVVLFKSELTAAGAIHAPIYSFPLGGIEDPPREEAPDPKHEPPGDEEQAEQA